MFHPEVEEDAVEIYANVCVLCTGISINLD